MNNAPLKSPMITRMPGGVRHRLVRANASAAASTAPADEAVPDADPQRGRRRPGAPLVTGHYLDYRRLA
jgi:hypothetical protein